jgi:hypothetical protein
VGSTFTIVGTGRLTTVGGGGQTLAIQIKLDSTIVADFAFVSGAIGGTGIPWSVQGIFTGLSTGVSGSYTQGSGLWYGNQIVQPTQSVASGTNTIDTTVTHTITIYALWGMADPVNSITQNTLLVSR